MLKPPAAIVAEVEIDRHTGRVGVSHRAHAYQRL